MFFLLRNFKIKIYFFSLLIILGVFTDVFYNLYAIVKRPYDERLLLNYGFGCQKYSYEFIQKVIQKQPKEQSLSIINFKNMAGVQYLFHQTKFDEKRKNLILLNFRNKENLKKYKINLNEYKLIENVDSCYFYKKND